MGGIPIEKIREGVEFVPDAAAAFRRAEAQVRAEFGRGIDVNSTYRSWDTQMSMYNAWNAYVGGWGPYPGHSKAVHPSESFHVSGLALDSDDWTNARIVQILAENGFIRNRLYVPGENHHFEYIRSEDKNYGQPAGSEGDENFMAKIDDLWQRWQPGQAGVKTAGDLYLTFADAVTKIKSLAQNLTAAKIRDAVWAQTVKRTSGNVSALQELADAKTNTITALAKLDELLKRPTASVSLTDAQVDALAKKVGEEVALSIAPNILDQMSARLKD